MVLSGLVTMCFGVLFCLFPVFSVHLAPKISDFLLFLKFGKILATISSNTFSLGIEITYILGKLKFFHSSLVF